MPYPIITQYKSVLLLPAGQRPLCSPELDSINLGQIVPSPNPMSLHWGSGAFAAVFRCRDTSDHEVALRCLISQPANDLAERYMAFDRFCALTPFPFLIRAQYIPDAIQVQRTWLPIFLMDWVRGKALDSHVADLARRHDTIRLQELALNWQQLVTTMQSAGIAHGDLQHGNVMVTDAGDLRLVDYDTMFVPSLAGRRATAIGKEGYVHPCYFRGVPRTYDAAMDTFGALIILLSLRALAYNPALFGRFSDDNLLFRGSDLDTPDRSAAFDELEAASDPDIADLARVLRAQCRQLCETSIEFPRAEPLGPAIQRVRRTQSPQNVQEYKSGSAIPRGSITAENQEYHSGDAIPARKTKTAQKPDYQPGRAIPRR